MAYSKVHGIKITLKKALDYIMDPKKTEGKLLVSGVNCTPDTAYQEFRLEHTIAVNQGRDNYSKVNDDLAKHIVQSFQQGEVTAGQAHQIGLELAEQLFQGKYQYIVTTHVDKGNIHNHIMVNVTNLKNHKKIRESELNWLSLWQESNKICQKYDLSWSDPEEYLKAKQQGKAFYKWQGISSGMSYKAQLQQAIDEAILSAKNYEELLELLKRKGYVYSKRGNTVSFKREEQKKATRLSSLGKDYREDRIAARIEALVNPVEQENLQIYLPEKVKQNGYYSSQYEIKKLAATIAILQQYDIRSIDVLQMKIEETDVQLDTMKDSFEQIDTKLQQFETLVTTLELYQNLKPVITGYEKALLKKNYYAKHEKDIELFPIIEAKLKAAGINPAEVDVDTISERKEQLKQHRKELIHHHKTTKNQLYELKRTMDHVQDILNKDRGTVRWQDKSQEPEL